MDTGVIGRGVIGLHRTKRVIDFVQIKVGEKVYAVDVKTKEWDAKYYVANDNKKLINKDVLVIEKFKM